MENYYYLLYFKFWDTCAERASLLHSIHVPWWFAAPINPSSTLGISPNAIPPLETFFSSIMLMSTFSFCLLHSNAMCQPHAQAGYT